MIAEIYPKIVGPEDLNKADVEFLEGKNCHSCIVLYGPIRKRNCEVMNSFTKARFLRLVRRRDPDAYGVLSKEGEDYFLLFIEEDSIVGESHADK